MVRTSISMNICYMKTVKLLICILYAQYWKLLSFLSGDPTEHVSLWWTNDLDLCVLNVGLTGSDVINWHDVNVMMSQKELKPLLHNRFTL